MSALTEFYLSSKSSVGQIECIEISDSSVSQVYYLVRNARDGIIVTHEDSTSHAYTYMPMRLELSGPRDDLDHVLQIVMGDLGEIIPQELDAVRDANTLSEMPVVIFRTYASDNLSAPLYGPIVLEVRRFSMDRMGCTFEAKAPSLNVSRTGEVYSIARFPMLAGNR